MCKICVFILELYVDFVYNMCIERKGGVNMKKEKRRVQITISEAAYEKIFAYGIENNVRGGFSGAVEAIAWNLVKVKNEPMKGQTALPKE